MIGTSFEVTIGVPRDLKSATGNARRRTVLQPLEAIAVGEPLALDSLARLLFRRHLAAQSNPTERINDDQSIGSLPSQLERQE